MGEYFLKPLPPDQLEQIVSEATRAYGPPGTFVVDSQDEVPCRRGEASIWQKKGKQGEEDELPCVTRYSGGCVHAQGVEPVSPLGQLLTELSARFSYSDHDF